MSFEIVLTERFDKEGDRLKKRYPSYKADFERFLDDLEQDPLLGVSIGKGCRKIRFAIKSKGKGKSGGARVITYVVNKNKEVYLLTIYDKAEFADIDDKTLRKIIQSLNSAD